MPLRVRFLLRRDRAGFGDRRGAAAVRLLIVNHRFQPATLTIPANTKVQLVIENRDATPEEFESNDFNREKIILPNSSAVIFVGPLRPGQYRFFGEFNPATAQGVLRVE